MTSTAWTDQWEPEPEGPNREIQRMLERMNNPPPVPWVKGHCRTCGQPIDAQAFTCNGTACEVGPNQ